MALAALVVVVSTALGTTAPAASGPPASPTWEVESINAVGCEGSATQFTMLATNVAGEGYRARTVVTAGGLVYMDEDAGVLGSDGDYGWSLYSSSSGGPTDASFPIAPDQEVRVDFTLENPLGTVFYSWTVIFDGCNTGDVLYNGPTSEIPPDTTSTTSTTATVDPTTGSPTTAVAAAAPAAATRPRFTG